MLLCIVHNTQYNMCIVGSSEGKANTGLGGKAVQMQWLLEMPGAGCVMEVIRKSTISLAF